MLFNHEDIQLDSTISSKAKLYKAGKLLFIGDGYKAITMMINIAQDKDPVKQKFKSQLELREKPKFKIDNENSLEAMRKEAHEAEEQRKKDLLRKPRQR